jgi:hypothetical protein
VATTALTETKNVGDDDPYDLKGSCDGAYVLYLTAARCARNPVFVGASKPDERKKIAHDTFDQLLDEMAKGGNEERTRQKSLRRLYRSTRLDFALHLIDPEYDPNRGLPKKKWREWPTAKGKKFLAQPDTPRQQFMTDMLALIIGGAEFWQKLEDQTRDENTAKNKVLEQWLVEHGLVGVGELQTAFAVITWNGQNSQKPPKFAKP